MIDLSLLNKLGVTQKTLRAAFTAKKPAPEIENITNRIRDRIKEAVESNMSDYRFWYAIDKAIDLPFHQKSYSLFQGMMENKWDSKKVLSTIQEWGGSSSWIKKQCGCDNRCVDLRHCSNPVTVLDLPTFFEVDFPIALAYLRIRVARMYNDRNLTPLFQYYPIVSTPEERLRCQLITQRIQVMTQQMNYKSVLKQLIHQSTAYGTCVLFPREAWYSDQQPEIVDKKIKYRTIKEGIRFDHPHPARMYYDLAYPAYTLNSDTGCQYAGYWSLVRYGDVADNKDYWNRDQITFGSDSFRITDLNRLFFETVYPCAMRFPDIAGNSDSIDREERLQFYTRHERDKALLLTNHFERLNPLNDLGLKNKDGEGYDGNVWFRFTVAGDNTVIHCEPLAFRPTTWSGYDADANRAKNPSIVLEAIPAQDMIHNLFSQAILQAKNNLANVSFVNSDSIPKEYIDELENFGEKTYRRPIFIPFSRHESRSTGEDKQDAIVPAVIQRMPINDLLTLVKGILDMLDRQLVMSAQEIASSASHEQTAQEVLQTAQSTSTRLTYTGSYIDDAIYYLQVALYDGFMAHGDDEVFAQVALQEEADKEVLSELGFEIESMNDSERTAGVRGSKKSLDITQFTVRRDAADRIKNVQVAAQMVQLFSAFQANPMFINSIGAGQLVKIFNDMADVLGFQRDWRLTAINDPIKEARDEHLEDRSMQKEDRKFAMESAKKQQDAQQVSGELGKILPQLAQKIQQDTIAAVGQQLQPVFEQSAEVDKKQQEQIQQLGEITVQNKQALDQLAQVLQAAQQPQQLPMLPPEIPPNA